MFPPVCGDWVALLWVGLSPWGFPFVPVVVVGGPTVVVGLLVGLPMPGAAAAVHHAHHVVPCFLLATSIVWVCGWLGLSGRPLHVGRVGDCLGGFVVVICGWATVLLLRVGMCPRVRLG